MRFSYLVPYSTLIPKGMCDQFGTKKSQSHAASRQQTATIEKRKPRQPARRKARNKHRKVTKETRGEDGKTRKPPRTGRNSKVKGEERKQQSRSIRQREPAKKNRKPSTQGKMKRKPQRRQVTRNNKHAAIYLKYHMSMCSVSAFPRSNDLVSREGVVRQKRV